MSSKHSRAYSESEDGVNYGRMESVPNSGAEDGASNGARMDSERSSNGKLSVNKVLETKDNSNDSSSHTQAQKSKRRQILSMSNRHLLCSWILSLSRFNTILFLIPLHCATGTSTTRYRPSPLFCQYFQSDTQLSTVSPSSQSRSVTDCILS